MFMRRSEQTSSLNGLWTYDLPPVLKNPYKNEKHNKTLYNKGLMRVITYVVGHSEPLNGINKTQGVHMYHLPLV